MHIFHLKDEHFGNLIAYKTMSANIMMILSQFSVACAGSFSIDHMKTTDFHVIPFFNGLYDVILIFKTRYSFFSIFIKSFRLVRENCAMLFLSVESRFVHL